MGQSVLPARWQIHRERGLAGICVCHGLLLSGVSHWLSSDHAALVVRKRQELWNVSVEQVPPKLDFMHPLNAHADVSSRTKGLKFGWSLHIHPYFCEGSGKTEQMHRLVWA